ncbi:unnamed protein product [Mesocestoides corti]|uniref:Adaptin_N domain-containing protein n=2 Tax=Mesocestoides corti TaxID=53468 RepID=A0A0R3UDX2_MESCO|nr:unnamed protein product [Mesocestoides corti]
MYRNRRIVLNSRISLNPPPNIDPTKATLAYGRLAISRLNRELKDETLLIRQRSVRALCDYLHDPEHISEAVHEGVISTLKTLLKDPDVPCRAIATECFVVLNQHSIGREAFINTKVLDVMKLLFSSYEPNIVRLNAHRSIELLVLNPMYTQVLVDADLIPLLLSCLEREFVEIKIIILETLNKCLALDSDAGLNANGMQVFTKLLSYHDMTVRHKSAQAILRLAVNNRGKQQAIEKETIPKLVNLLLDEDSEVRASAAGALAFISVITPGRYATLNANAIPNLLRCLLSPNSRVRVNSLKALACIAEAPEGRRVLQTALQQIECMMDDENAGVRKHAKITADVIKWKPWDLGPRCQKVPTEPKPCNCKNIYY